MIVYNNNELLENNLNKEYINRSKLYLYRSIEFLQSYSLLKQHLNKIICFSIGINKIQGLGIVFNVEKDFGKITEIINKAKEYNEYIDDMIIDRTKHIIIFKAPFNLGAFVKGEYTDLYTKEQLKSFKGNEKVFPVLTKDPKYFDTFLKLMKESFEVFETRNIGENLNEDMLKSYEQLDIPPCLGQEIIWWKL